MEYNDFHGEIKKKTTFMLMLTSGFSSGYELMLCENSYKVKILSARIFIEGTELFYFTFRPVFMVSIT